MLEVRVLLPRHTPDNFVSAFSSKISINYQFVGIVSEVPEGFPAVVGTRNIAYVTRLHFLSTQVRYRRSGAPQL
jgi:hypothetical protein